VLRRLFKLLKKNSSPILTAEVNLLSFDHEVFAMNPIPPEQLFAVLRKINGSQVETFNSFPEIIRAGAHQLPKDDFDYLLSEGYLEEKKTDSFGKLLQLSDRARNVLKSKD
jgi:hypothetical protein